MFRPTQLESLPDDTFSFIDIPLIETYEFVMAEENQDELFMLFLNLLREISKYQVEKDVDIQFVKKMIIDQKPITNDIQFAITELTFSALYYYMFTLNKTKFEAIKRMISYFYQSNPAFKSSYIFWLSQLR